MQTEPATSMTPCWVVGAESASVRREGGAREGSESDGVEEDLRSERKLERTAKVIGALNLLLLLASNRPAMGFPPRAARPTMMKPARGEEGRGVTCK